MKVETKGLVLLVCLSMLNYPMVVLGCSCVLGPVLTQLQTACLDYQRSEDVFSARVISRCSECASGGPFGDCFAVGHSYTIEVVEVFKGSHQVLYVFYIMCVYLTKF